MLYSVINEFPVNLLYPKLTHHSMFDVQKIRELFPILHQNVYGKPLVYFDNAATTQKPLAVIDAVSGYYKTINSNIHRGVHYLSQKATLSYEEARKNVCDFIGAAHAHEIIFTRGTTESINLVAGSFGKKFIGKDDEIILTGMEHHSNIVPWQILCEEKQAKIRVIPVKDNGELDLSVFESMINTKTRLVAVTHVSNALGTINPVKKIAATAHRYNIPLLLDGAQAVSHMKVDVRDLDCDFYCFSGHKIFAPMGIGVLYGKEAILNEMPPYQGGGEMIREVRFEKTTYNELPFKFEAGTPNVGDVIGLDVALKFFNQTGISEISSYEKELLLYAEQRMNTINDLRLIGTAKEKAGVISFLIGNIHPYDAGTIMDKLGIAVRTGHHCAQPLMERFGIPGTIRASFAFYNTKEEIDRFINAIFKVKEIFE